MAETVEQASTRLGEQVKGIADDVKGLHTKIHFVYGIGAILALFAAGIWTEFLTSVKKTAAVETEIKNLAKSERVAILETRFDTLERSLKSPAVFKGTVERIDGNILTATNATGTEPKTWQCKITSETVVTLGGTDAKANDLKPGTWINAVVKADGEAILIAATPRSGARFVNPQKEK
jgi:hypothetical protein